MSNPAISQAVPMSEVAYIVTKQIKSKQRVADHGEVFTAEREVEAMCDLVKQETERIDSRFLDQTTPNMIQRLNGIFEIKPLISRVF